MTTPDPALKGKKNGNCNRQACQRPVATDYNVATDAYYCEPCGRRINREMTEEDRATALRAYGVSMLCLPAYPPHPGVDDIQFRKANQMLLDGHSRRTAAILIYDDGRQKAVPSYADVDLTGVKTLVLVGRITECELVHVAGWKTVTKDEFYASMGPKNVHPRNNFKFFTEWRLLTSSDALVGISIPGYSNPGSLNPARYFLRDNG